MTRSSLLLPVLAVLLVFGFCATAWWSFGVFETGASATQVWVESARQLGAANVVSAIYLGVRLLDTLLEVLVFTVAVLGVRFYLELPHGRSGAPESVPESHVVRASASFLLPLILLIGIYVTAYGHLSPGGGFSGGAIAATGWLLAAIALGPDRIGERFDEPILERIEWGILVVLMGGALLPLLGNRPPLSDLLPAGRFGTLLSGGSLLPYNLLIGAKVLIGSWVVIHHFLRHRGDI